MTQNLDAKIPYGVTLYPSEAEFADFRAYAYGIARNPKFKDVGFVKVR